MSKKQHCRQAGQNAHPVTPFTRTEDEGISRLRVPVPEGEVPVSTVTLSTDAPTFSRRVTLLRAAGQVLDPMRSLRWVGSDRPGAITVEVDRIVGDELVVELDNGDDPPLPVDEIALTWPAWELLAVLPGSMQKPSRRTKTPCSRSPTYSRGPASTTRTRSRGSSRRFGAR